MSQSISNDKQGRCITDIPEYEQIFTRTVYVCRRFKNLHSIDFSIQDIVVTGKLGDGSAGDTIEDIPFIIFIDGKRELLEDLPFRRKLADRVQSLQEFVLNQTTLSKLSCEVYPINNKEMVLKTVRKNTTYKYYYSKRFEAQLSYV